MKTIFLRVWMTLFSVWFSFLPFVQQTSAAPLTFVRDVMSRQAIGQFSTHGLFMTTPTGVDASTDTITVTFDPAFTVNPLTSADVLFSHGPTGVETIETMGAVAAAGIWGITSVGNIVTVTAPTDAALGEIAAGHVIRLVLDVSGTKIQNPATGGQDYGITIGGTFGDSHALRVPITVAAGDQIGVSVTVNTTTGGGGGGGGGGCVGLACSDFTAPSILNLRVVNITTSTALVLWDTNESATSLLDLGQTLTYEMGSFTNASALTAHSQLLTGLTSSTLYHLRVTATDLAGNMAVSPDLTFTTLADGVVTPSLFITNVQVLLITDTTAVVTWNTNLLADSRVDFGQTTSYGQLSLDDVDTTSHLVNLSGLAPGTTYHLKVTSATDTLSTSTTDIVFTTLADTRPPANARDFIATGDLLQNQLSWTNPPESDFSYVRILSKTSGYPSGPNDGILVYQGSATQVTHGGLIAGTRYFYTNFAYDRSGNRSSGIIADAMPFGLTPTSTTSTEPLPTPTPTSTPPVSTSTTPTVTSTPELPTPTSTTSTPELPVTTSTVTTTLPVATSTQATSTPAVRDQVLAPTYSLQEGLFDLVIEDGVIYTVPDQTVTVRISANQIKGDVTQMMFTIGKDRYLLTRQANGDYTASFVPPTGTTRGTVTISYADGRRATGSTDTVVGYPGFIFERYIPLLGEKQPIKDAKIIVYVLRNGEWVEWSGAQTRQPNPWKTSDTGRWGYAVENGLYRVVIDRDGYERVEKEVSVTNNVLGFEQELRKPSIVPEVTGVVATVAAVANVATLASLLNYLWYLLTQPFLLFGARKRKKWGVVYNAITKQPIDLVAVRLIHAQTGLVLQTRVTDDKGRFFFHVKKGQYKIDVVKAGYVYPSETTKGLKEDDEYLDVYHGGVLIAEDETDLTPNIPLDPNLPEETPKRILIKQFLRKVQNVVALISVIITAIALAIEPGWLLAGLLLFQVATYLMFKRLIASRKPKNWGIVSEEGTKKPVEKVIMRIYDKKYNKLLETQVTDGRGRYGFLAGKNTYFITADKPGFDRYRSDDIDLTNAKELTVEKPVKLKRQEPKPLPKPE